LVTNEYPQDEVTRETAYSGWIASFIMFLPTAAYSRRAYRPRLRAAPGVRGPPCLRVAEPVVLHEAFDEPVEGQVVAPVLLGLSVLLDGDHVEGLAEVLLLRDLDGLPALLDGLLELGHHRIVPPAGHVSRPRGPWRSRAGTARSTWSSGPCRSAARARRRGRARGARGAGARRAPAPRWASAAL